MNQGSDESWVTIAHDDLEALQAWTLAISIKRSFTKRKLTIIVSDHVSPPFIFVLRQEFDLVLREALGSTTTITGGGSLLNQKNGISFDQSSSKLWCWSLKLWSKCVFVGANSLFLQNCDNLFDHDEFSSTSGTNSAAAAAEAGVFICKPNLETFEKILRHASQQNGGNVDKSLDSFFNGWSLEPNNVLDNSYSHVFDKDDQFFNGYPKILVYKTSPWILNSNQWLQVYYENVLPAISMMEEASPIKSHLIDFLAKNKLPMTKPPLNSSNCSLPTGNDDELLKDSIAIIGMSCRFAESNSPDEFWKLLSEGQNGVKPFPVGRKNTYQTSDIEGVESGFLKCPVDEFDAKFFGISPREAPFIDPQQRLLLEVIWEALEHAGIVPSSLKDSRTGAYVGIWQQDYETFIGSKGLSSSEFHHRYLGNAFSATSSRISYFLGLLGPNIALESGCSSSLSALHLACEGLKRGEISLAISSGVNLTLGVAKPLTMDTKTIVLSPDYRCKTFDESADGFVRAEGCGALILKRTIDAIKDGDNVLAIIRGSAMNNDGAGTSFGTPNANSQEKVFRQALLNAKISPGAVSFVEAHGTGTAVGDPIEMHALSRVYSEGRDRSKPLFVASVKTNIGHAESAAGIAGLIKTVLALKHKQIPPHLNLKTLNPHIDLSVIPAVIPSALTEWEANDAGRIAAVSSFSMSGTNVHVILQEPPPALLAVREPSPSPDQQQLHLVTLSAKTSDSLKALISSYLAYFSINPGISLQNIAYTANYCRGHNFSHRVALMAASVPALVKNLEKKDYAAAGKIPTLKTKIGFLFTGQGCQYVGMGENLYVSSPSFKHAFLQCKKLYQTHLNANLDDILWKTDDEHGGLLQSTIYCQPAIFCLQYCLVQHWAGFGITPDFVLGHSVGEFAAAVAAGIFTLEEAMKLVIERSRLVQNLAESRMLVLRTSIERVKSFLKSFQNSNSQSATGAANVWVDIAAINSSAEVVVSATKETVEALEAYCVNNQIKCQRLASSHAFHSRAMDPIMAAFETAVKAIIGGADSASRKLTCTYISGTKAKAMELNDLLASAYWKEHLRNTVRFSDAIQLLGSPSNNCNVLLEIGPQPILLGLAMGNLDGKGGDEAGASPSMLFCPSLRRSNEPDWSISLNTLAKLYVAGIDIDWSKWYINGNGGPAKSGLTKLALPTYTFDRQRYWYSHSDEEGYDDGDFNGGGVGFNLHTKLCHPVLGRQIPSPLTQTIYCQSLSLSTLPYVVDHKVGGKIILPGAVYLEGALAVGKELLGTTSSSIAVPLTIQNLSIEAALEIEPKRSIQMQTLVNCLTSSTAKEGGAAEDNNSAESGSGSLQYKISFHRPMVAGQYDNWKRHASATFLPVAPNLSATQFTETLDIEKLKSRLSFREDSISSAYTALVDKGIEFGPQFQSIASAWTNENEILTLVQLPPVTAPPPGGGVAALTDANNNTGTSYICHPIVLDAMFQTFAFGTLLNGTLAKDDHWLRLPLSIKRFTWMGHQPTSTLYLYSSTLSSADDGQGQISLYDEHGTVLAVLEGLELIKVSVDSFIRAIRAESVPIPDFYQETWSPRIGISSHRFDLELLNLVTNDSEKTHGVVKTCNERLERSEQGMVLTNSMCFHYIIKSLLECGWKWPAIGQTIAFDTWKTNLPEQLKATRIHYTFMAAFIEEGFIQPDPGGDDSKNIVLRALPSVQECEAKIAQLQVDIEPYLFEDVRLYEFSLHCCQNLSAVVQGKISQLSVLFPSDPTKIGASRFYQESGTYTLWSDVSVAAFADHLAKIQEKEPSSSNVLRILEVGAGTGATAGKLIKLLSELGIKYQYTFTDISHQFLEKAQEQFGTNPSVTYSILNLEQDPLAQGYCPHDYDIVLAFQVLHATLSLPTTLAHIQMLMRDNGTLMMTEQIAIKHFIKVSFALLDGWWRFNDFRTTSAVIGKDEWLALLDESGFTDTAVIETLDDTCGFMISRADPVKRQKIFSAATGSPTANSRFLPSSTTAPAGEAKTWILFGNKTSLSSRIAEKLRKMKRNVLFGIPNLDSAKSGIMKTAPNEYVIDYSSEEQFKQVLESVLGIGGAGTDKKAVTGSGMIEGAVYFCTDHDPDLNQIQLIEQHKIGGLLHFFQAISSTTFGSTNSSKFKPKVIVLTKGIHYMGDQKLGNPANATAWGCFRSFVNECRDFNSCIIDLDQDQVESEKELVGEACQPISAAAIEEITAQFWSSTSNAHLPNADRYIMLRGDKKYVHKMMLMDKPAPPMTLPANTERYAFINPPSGSFSDIQVGPEPTRLRITNPRYVEIALRAVGLNFRDLLCVLKPPGFEAYLTGGTAGNYDVGGDISGVVTAIGSEVTKLAVGDEVFGFTTTGGLRSHTITHEAYLVKKPAWMTFTGAATLPVVFLTSYYCLIELGHIKSTDRVLIHVATGGVGLSAIQIARQAGATIYATAGSKRKRSYLRLHLGIRYVYNSRSLDYGEAIMKDTGGAGVTMVLNSLTSPGFKETTLNCCSAGAQFLEIGKLNIWTAEEVAERRPDVKYYIIDLASPDESNAEAIQDTFGKLSSNFENGLFNPIPFTTFALERLRDAFYYFQEAKHIGKIVIKMPIVELAQQQGKLLLKHRFFDPESTYLITGGLGGLGVEVTKWMTSTGAKHIILVGRTAPAPQIRTLLDALNASTGSNIITYQVDIGDYNQVVQLLATLKANPTLPPLRGIFHASGVLADALVQNQSWEKFNTVFHPKVYGAWWLHQLTLNYDLEFFTMFSSMVAIIGMMGQTTHAAASRFLDSLAHYRVSMGLPGETVNWGAWSDVGAAAFLKLGQEGLVGIRAFTPSQGIHALEKFMLQNYTQACVLDVPDWTIVQQFLNLGSFLTDLKCGTASSADSSAQYAKLAEEINNCPPEEKQGKIQDYLEQILKHTLRLAPSDVIDPDQNFTELGVDSLMAMEMRNRLQGILVKSNKTLSINALQDNRTLRSLSTHLANLINSSEVEEKPIMELLKTDCVLPEDLVEALENVKSQPAPNPADFREVLLTGATGFLGSHILLELLAHSRLVVHCLVRAPTLEDGKNKLVDAFKRFKVTEELDLEELLVHNPRVRVVLGNVGSDSLGLATPEEYQQLASTVDAILHCAIKSNHLEGYGSNLGDPNSLRSNNVIGLLHVLRFVVTGKLKCFCHASSLLAITNVTEDGLLTEDFPTLDDYTELLKNGYSISKFVSEILIGQAIAAGLSSVKVLRYPSIWGNSRTGFISLDNNFNHGWNLLTTCLRFRKFPYMDNKNGIVIVPVDVAASVTRFLFLSTQAEPGVYNMTTKTGVTQAVMEEIMKERGIEAEFLPLSQWRNEIFGNPGNNETGGLESDPAKEGTDGPTLEAFRWLYEDDDDGDQLRFRTHHPLFKRLDSGAIEIQANCISEKMARNLDQGELEPLKMSAKEVINKHLDHYLLQ